MSRFHAGRRPFRERRNVGEREIAPAIEHAADVHRVEHTVLVAVIGAGGGDTCAQLEYGTPAASAYIGAQIAEAWAKRRYEKHFVSKLTDADGEQMETQHWLISAFDSGYISRAQGQSLTADLQEIGRMLHSMMDKADEFCGDRPFVVREATAEYVAGPELDDLDSVH